MLARGTTSLARFSRHYQSFSRPVRRSGSNALMQVSPQDWQAALAGSAAPCSLRVGLAGLSAPAASPLPAHLVPLLLPGIGQAACCLSRQAWPLSPQASLAAAIAVAQLRARCAPEQLQLAMHTMPKIHI